MLRRTLTALLLIAACAIVTLPVAAQQGGTVRYVYDDNGRLKAVILPSGEANEYEYDAAGNITAIKRLMTDALAVFSFAPREGFVGEAVTFIGVGFGSGVDSVSFNGVAARVLSFDATTVVAEVPEGVTTGPVTITTPRGSVTTTTPFALRGVRVSPSVAKLLYGESVQFVAQVATSDADTSVVWSVNGVQGGNATVGRISATGLYTASNREAPSLVIRATSNADPSLYGEAQVSVRDPNNLQAAFASVSVRRGYNTGETITSTALTVKRGGTIGAVIATSPAVTVRRGTTDASFASARSVSVQRGTAASAFASAASVSVRRGTTETAHVSASPVTIEFGGGVELRSIISAGTSVTTGPHISSVSPLRIVRGTTASVTIVGSNLNGVASLMFLTESGAIDATISVTNITSDASGTSLNAMLNVSTSAVIGKRVVIVSAAGINSSTSNTRLNSIEIVQ